MKFKKLFKSILFLIILGNSHQMIGQADGTMIKDGNCYTKCLIPEFYKNDTLYIFEYTGSDLKNKFVKDTIIIISPERKKSTKVRIKGCQSKYKLSCFKKETIIIPESSLDFSIVLDTNKVKEYKITQVIKKNLIPGGYTEFKQVVCEEDKTPELLRKIKTKLEMFGFSDDDKSANFDAEDRRALVEYQQSKGLAIGAITFETLENLEIDYKK